GGRADIGCSVRGPPGPGRRLAVARERAPRAGPVLPPCDPLDGGGPALALRSRPPLQRPPTVLVALLEPEPSHLAAAVRGRARGSAARNGPGRLGRTRRDPGDDQRDCRVSGVAAGGVVGRRLPLV